MNRYPSKLPFAIGSCTGLSSDVLDDVASPSGLSPMAVRARCSPALISPHDLCPEAGFEL